MGWTRHCIDVCLHEILFTGVAGRFVRSTHSSVTCIGHVTFARLTEVCLRA